MSTISLQRAWPSLLTLVLILASRLAVADVVAVVSSQSTLTSLSDTQLLDIFLGRVSRLADGTPIVAIDQPEGSVDRDAFYAKLAGKSAAQMKAYWSKIIFTGRGQPPKEMAGGAQMRDSIAKNPGTIGYVEEKFVDASVRVIK